MGVKGYDLTGKIFGRLTVIKDTGKRKAHCKVWLCKCECGNDIEATTNHLNMGQTKSCGCYQKEVSRKTQYEYNFKHGKTKTRIHRIWCNVKTRCYNPKSTHYKYYGGLNIKMCDEWLKDFMNFYNWSMENGYNDKLTLDRINGTKDYSPDNCRWVTMKEQNDNRKSNIIVSYEGKEYTLSNLAKEIGVSEWMLYKRYSKGIRPPELFKPSKVRIIEINGELKTVKEWSEIYGIGVTTINKRFNEGLTGEDLFKEPQKGLKKTSITDICSNKTKIFNSIIEAAEYVKVNPRRLGEAIKNGKKIKGRYICEKITNFK